MAEITITQENFENVVLKSDKPVLIDFWASWCGPCKMLAPTIAKIAAEHDEIVVGKVNVDDEPTLARKFGIMSIPTLILFKNGQPIKKSVGVVPESSIVAML